VLLIAFGKRPPANQAREGQAATSMRQEKPKIWSGYQAGHTKPVGKLLCAQAGFLVGKPYMERKHLGGDRRDICFGWPKGLSPHPRGLCRDAIDRTHPIRIPRCLRRASILKEVN